MTFELPAENVRNKRRQCGHPGGGESRTEQSHALQTDINSIMGKWTHTQRVPGSSKPMTYGDFTGVGDYHQAVNRVLEAQGQFDQLPVAVKKHVNQDPGQFLDMVYDPERVGELEELGLIPQRNPAKVETPPEAPAVPPAAE